MCRDIFIFGGQVCRDYMGKKCRKFRPFRVRISVDVIRRLLFGGLTGNQRNFVGCCYCTKIKSSSSSSSAFVWLVLVDKVN